MPTFLRGWAPERRPDANTAEHVWRWRLPLQVLRTEIYRGVITVPNLAAGNRTPLLPAPQLVHRVDQGLSVFHGG